MEIRYPDYYGKFKCLAGKCPDTCCAGWEIPVDPKSEKYYQKLQKEAVKSGDPGQRAFAKKLQKHIRGGHIVGNGNYCPFLDHEGLCEVYKELGPSALCRTCRQHPRHMEDYGDLHEAVLLLSCPEAARLILWENDGGYHVRRIPERTGNMDGIDRELLSLLLSVREKTEAIIRNRELSVDRRMALALSLCHDVQGRLNHKDLSGVKEVLKRRGEVRSGGKKNARFFLMADFMEQLAETDVICADFADRLEACRRLLYHSPDSRGRYEEDRVKFLRENPGLREEWENLLGYFMYSFFLGALYDRDALEKLKLSALCTMAVEDMNLAAWRSGNAVEKNVQIEICHGLGRQVENSARNREKLEKAMRKQAFSSRRLLNGLLE